MAKVSLTILSNRADTHGEHTVMLQLSAHNKTIRVVTDVSVKKEHWLKKEGQVKSGREGDPLATNKNVRLTQIKNQCEVKMMNNPDQVSKMEVQALRKFLLSENESVDTNFFNYCKKRENHFRGLGRKKSADLLMSTASKLKDFWATSELDFSDITVSFLEKFEAYCLRTPIKVYGKKSKKEITHKMTPNGLAVYMRNIRTVINSAIDDDLIEKYPFKKYKIKTEPTRNRNLSVQDIQRIRDFSTEDKRMQIARDFFMLSIYLQGINLYDLFWMKAEKVLGGRLQYHRAKTGRFHNVKIEKEASDLIDKYRGDKYLLWFADLSSPESTKGQRRKHARQTEFQYRNEEAFTKMINTNLEKIQKELKIKPEVKITMYYCRHSFASILREIGVSIDDIQLCLGHKAPNQKVTGIYIDEDFVRADLANRKLIDYIQKKGE